MDRERGWSRAERHRHLIAGSQTNLSEETRNEAHHMLRDLASRPRCDYRRVRARAGATYHSASTSSNQCSATRGANRCASNGRADGGTRHYGSDHSAADLGTGCWWLGPFPFYPEHPG